MVIPNTKFTNLLFRMALSFVEFVLYCDAFLGVPINSSKSDEVYTCTTSIVLRGLISTTFFVCDVNISRKIRRELFRPSRIFDF